MLRLTAGLGCSLLLIGTRARLPNRPRQRSPNGSGNTTWLDGVRSSCCPFPEAKCQPLGLASLRGFYPSSFEGTFVEHSELFSGRNRGRRRDLPTTLPTAKGWRCVFSILHPGVLLSRKPSPKKCVLVGKKYGASLQSTPTPWTFGVAAIYIGDSESDRF